MAEPGTYEFFPVSFGTFEVRLTAVDRAGNRSLPSAATRVAIAAPDLPPMPGNVATTDLGTAVGKARPTQKPARSASTTATPSSGAAPDR